MSNQQSLWHLESPSNALTRGDYSVYSETGERTRKRHQKSKGGCLRCKRRHIKCSEERPVCANCRRLGKICQYRPNEVEDGPAQSSSRISVANPGRDSPMYISALRSQIDAALASTDELDPDLAHLSPLTRRHAFESLEHFLQCDHSWLKTPSLQSIMQQQAGPDQVLHEPHLLHAILAVSTAHLAVLKPESEKQSYSLTSSVHSQRSLRLYTDCLNSDLGQRNIDALYFTSHILSILAFHAMPHRNEARDWQISTFVDPMRGMDVLKSLPLVAARLQEGVWQEVIRSCELWHQGTRDRLLTEAKNGSPALTALRIYCSSLPSEEAQYYNERIDMLGVLESCSSTPSAISLVSSFVGKAPPEYIARLRNGEEVALLLLLYWSRLFSRCDQWWLTPSATLLHSRLHAHIHRSATSEQIRSLLSIVAGSQGDVE